MTRKMLIILMSACFVFSHANMKVFAEENPEETEITETAEESEAETTEDTAAAEDAEEEEEAVLPEQAADEEIIEAEVPADPEEEISEEVIAEEAAAEEEEYAAVYNGFETVSGKTYYYRYGSRVTGLQTIDGKIYYFNSAGEMQKGWQKVSGSWYFFKTNGAAEKGWKLDNGKLYFLDRTTAVMATGVKTIDGKIYGFDSSGKQIKGWQALGGKWYFFKADGAAEKGWKVWKDKWYFLDRSTAVMATGLQTIDGKIYYFNSSGAMLKGWQKTGGKWYFFKSNGAAEKGWKKDGGKWYFLDRSTAIMATGKRTIDGKIYAFDYSSGAMLKGWQKIFGSWYFFKSDGAAEKGWKKWNGDWYFLDRSTGVMATGTKTVDGYPNVFRSDGVWLYKQKQQPIVYSDSRVTIRFKDISDKGVVFQVDNYTNVTVTIQCRSISVNGYSTNEITMSDDVAPYSTGDVVAKVKSNNILSADNIDRIAGRFCVFDWNDSFQTYYPVFDVKLNDHPGYFEADYSGFPLVHSDSKVDIYYFGVDSERVYYIVRNKTGVNLTIQARSLALNGSSVSNIIMSDDIAPHSVGIANTKCSFSVSSVYRISGTFCIFDWEDSFQTYYPTFNVYVD